MPLVKATRYLIREPRIERARSRAWVWAGCGVGGVLAFLAFVPMPNNFRAPGLVRAEGSADVYTQVPGWLAEVTIEPGSAVEEQVVLARMESPELEFAIAAARADLEEAVGRERQMLSDLAAGIEPTRVRREASEQRVAQLEIDRLALQVRAPSSGLWVALERDKWEGTWLPRGVRLGEIVGNSPDWEFSAVVAQENASELFGAIEHGAGVRFPGRAGVELEIDEWRVVPGRQNMLPSAALGWTAGGPVRVSAEDNRGLRTEEPFFLVVGRIEGGSALREAGESLLWQGRVGVVRFDLPWSPLFVQWARQFRQLLQDRFQI